MAHDPSQPPADWPTLAHRLNEDVIRPMLQLVLLTEPRGQDRDAAKLETVFEVACRYAGRTTSVGELAQESSLSSGEDADLEEFAHYLQALADTALIRLLPWPGAEPQPPTGRHQNLPGGPCTARQPGSRERVPLAPDALDASPELTTLAGHMAQSVLGATASVIRGLDIDRVPTPPREF